MNWILINGLFTDLILHLLRVLENWQSRPIGHAAPLESTYFPIFTNINLSLHNFYNYNFTECSYLSLGYFLPLCKQIKVSFVIFVFTINKLSLFLLGVFSEGRFTSFSDAGKIFVLYVQKYCVFWIGSEGFFLGTF